LLIHIKFLREDGFCQKELHGMEIMFETMQEWSRLGALFVSNRHPFRTAFILHFIA